MAQGVCQKGAKDLSGDLSVERLSQLFFKYVDFCVGRDTPSLEQLRKFKGKVEEYGIFVDDEVKTDDLENAVLNGDCKGFLKYTGYSVSRLFVRHTSQAAVNVEDFANVTIDVFDNTHLYLAVAGTNAKVFVNVYGDAQVECNGSGIQLEYKHKNTY